MKDTAFKLTPEHRSRLVAMHARGEDGALTAIPFEMPQEPEFEMGGGGLYSTAADYLAFQQIFLNEGRAGGKQVLRSETVRMMSENSIGDLKVGPLKTVMANYSNDADFFPGMLKKWGLGFMISTAQVPSGRNPGSLAWAGLGNTYFWIDPKEGVAGVILMQLLPFADPKALDLFEGFEKGVYAGLA
jgi:methyl acetate hydrolase